MNIHLAAPGLVAVLVLSASRIAAAQDQPLPQGAQDQAKATSGATDLTTNKAVTADRAAAKETKDATELSISAGGMQSGGNANLLALTGTGKFRLRRDDNQFKSALAGNFAQASAPGSTDRETTVQNVQGMARYDRFLGDFTVFFLGQVRNDKFQGLNLRLQADPGFAYYFVNEKTQLLWTELGYDFMYDIRRDDALIVLDAKGVPVLVNGVPQELDKTRTLHSGRAFVGYEYAFNDASKVTAGIEYLQGLSDTGARRLNGDVALTTKLVKALSISFAFSDRYDSSPLPGKKNNDTLTSASLVYTFL